jgi:hypothetical protein
VTTIFVAEEEEYNENEYQFVVGEVRKESQRIRLLLAWRRLKTFFRHKRAKSPDGDRADLRCILNDNPILKFLENLKKNPSRSQ